MNVKIMFIKFHSRTTHTSRGPKCWGLVAAPCGSIWIKICILLTCDAIATLPKVRTSSANLNTISGSAKKMSFFSPISAPSLAQKAQLRVFNHTVCLYSVCSKCILHMGSVQPMRIDINGLVEDGQNFKGSRHLLVWVNLGKNLYTACL